MTEGRLEVESKSQECLVIIKREVTSNNLPKRRVLSSTHGVVGGRRLVTASYPINNQYALSQISQTPNRRRRKEPHTRFAVILLWKDF